jgi:hypothetical protein
MSNFDGDRSAGYFAPGLGSVGAYQISGIPYITSSLSVPSGSSTPLKIQFPGVSNYIYVKNTMSTASAAAPIRFGFSQNGVSGSSATHYMALSNGESFQANWRVEDIYLIAISPSATGSAMVAAGITPIPRGIPPVVEGWTSGSRWNNWSGSSGIG